MIQYSTVLSMLLIIYQFNQKVVEGFRAVLMVVWAVFKCGLNQNKNIFRAYMVYKHMTCVSRGYTCVIISYIYITIFLVEWLNRYIIEREHYNNKGKELNQNFFYFGWIGCIQPLFWLNRYITNYCINQNKSIIVNNNFIVYSLCYVFLYFVQ